MCLNCGCGEPANDQGKPANITLNDLREAAAANGQTLRESAQHILDAIDAHERAGSVESMRTAGGESGNPGLGSPAGDEPAPAAGRGTPGTES